eukprot:scaffold15537_cov170-Amphora_coffeaeformis.AAC.4
MAQISVGWLGLDALDVGHVKIFIGNVQDGSNLRRLLSLDAILPKRPATVQILHGMWEMTDKLHGDMEFTPGFFDVFGLIDVVPQFSGFIVVR